VIHFVSGVNMPIGSSNEENFQRRLRVALAINQSLSLVDPSIVQGYDISFCLQFLG
jgi:hypothetical protein